MIIFIYNNYNCHYEIIYNVLYKYNEIIKMNKTDSDILYIELLSNNKNIDFINLIKSQFNNVFFEKPTFYDYYINCTIYDSSNSMNKNQKVIEDDKHFYISHEVFKTNNKNIYFVTPLNNNNYLKCDILPFQNEIQNEVYSDSKIPIYVIQGSIDCNRRNYNLLETILSISYKYDFKIKLIGSSKKDESETFIKKFDKYKDKLLIKTNLEFTDYHKEFLDCYCLLPLTSKSATPQYYTDKLTSSINYILAYNLYAILDKDLQDIYNIPKAYVYNNEIDIVYAFFKSLYHFYNRKPNRK